MKRGKLGIYAGIVISLIALLSGCAQHSSTNTVTRIRTQGEMVWGVKADTRLFGLMNIRTGNIEGFDVDIARAVTTKMYGGKVKPKFIPVTSGTRLPLLKNGNVEAVIATMTITPERAKEVAFSNTYFAAGQAILVKKGSAIRSVRDLKRGTTVLGIQGSNSVETIKKFAPQARLLQLSDAAQAFTALQSGQGDALTSDNGILYGMAADNANYHVVGGTFTKEPYGIAVNRGQKQLVAAINRALAAIKRDGTYQKIYDKWFKQVAQ